MLSLLVIITAAAQFVSLAKINLRGEVSKPLVLFVYSGYTVIELWLAVEVSWFMLLFVALNIWSIVTTLYRWYEEIRPSRRA